MSISKNERLEVIQNILNGLEEYWLDTNGFIYATNLEAINITGYEEAEMIGKHFSILYPKEGRDKNLPQEDLARVLKTKSFKTKSIRLKKNNIKFLSKINFETGAREQGGVGIKMTIQDITYSTIQNHKLKHLESHYNSLFHNHFVGVLNIDDQGLKISLANVKACEMLGEFELVGKNLGGYLALPNSLDSFRRIIDAEEEHIFELPLMRRDGKTIWAQMQCSYFQVEGVVELLMFDITEEKNRIRELERINTHLDQFIYHVSHDLRAPLTTLLGLLMLVKKEVPISASTDYIGLMEDRVRHLDTILVDLTSIAFNEKASIESSEFCFEKEINEMLKDFAESPIIAELVVQQSKTFFTDVKRLRIIIRNLLSNAFKYSNPAEPTPFVKLRVCSDAKKAIIEIEDNGMGIHPSFIEKIFEMFFRATTRSSGSGLGLYIVSSIVNKLNGTITVKSIPDRGTTFQVTIPNQLKATTVSIL
ncbi:MAG: PAS domain-containing protein [Bacteroidetes bacterium]|nr:PAS domain-containing protein [Bacteroidota bacterium]